MAMWICRNCNALMNVKDELVGTEQQCPRCSQVMIVQDADAPRDPREQQDSASRTPPPPPTVVATSSSQPDPASALPHVLLSVRIARGILSLIAGMVPAMLFLAFMTNHPETRWLLCYAAISFSISVALSWPIYTGIQETYHSRQLLEKIEKNTSAR